MCGFLEIILGPMFSGKTTRLIEIYNRYKHTKQNVIAINYTLDTRYDDNMLSTHDKIKIPCVFTEDIASLLDKEDIKNADIILINEGQFFQDIVSTVKTLVEKMNKKVYICGLDGDFERNKFGNLLELIPFCDNVTKLHSNCHSCSADAIFSHRTSQEAGQVVIGSLNYVPLCRKCYNL